MNIITQRKRKASPSSVQLADARDAITRATVGMRGPHAGGLKLDFAKLDVDEGTDVVRLTRVATEGGGFSFGRLGKRDRVRLEGLIERASGDEGLFGRQRDEAVAQAEIARLAREAQRPPRRPRFEQPGTVALPAELLDWLVEVPPVIWAEHLAVLSVTLLQIENVTALAPHARIEGAGDSACLVLDRRYGLVGGKHDPDDRLIRWRECLLDLQRLEWLVVEQHGQEVRVARGRRALEIAAGRKP